MNSAHISMFRIVITALGLLTSSGCTIYREAVIDPTALPRTKSIRYRSAAIDVVLPSDVTVSELLRQACALELLDLVRGQPEFISALKATHFRLGEADATEMEKKKIIECATAPIKVVWRARHAVWPFKGEIGSTQPCGEQWCVKTYDTDILRSDVSVLAGHVLHEHMHTCWSGEYTDGNGSGDGGVPSYEMNNIIERLGALAIGNHGAGTNICSGLTGLTTEP